MDNDKNSAVIVRAVTYNFLIIFCSRAKWVRVVDDDVDDEFSSISKLFYAGSCWSMINVSFLFLKLLIIKGLKMQSVLLDSIARYRRDN